MSIQHCGLQSSQAISPNCMQGGVYFVKDKEGQEVDLVVKVCGEELACLHITFLQSEAVCAP